MVMSEKKVDLFKTGDKAYFAAQGVGIIRKVETREIGGTSQDFYIVQVLSSGAKLMIPTTAATKAGMRNLIDEKDIRKVYKILKTPRKVNQTTWNRRFREYNEKLRTGSPEEIAKVLRDLYTLQDNKDLSFGEKEMLEKARSLIVEEISYARKSKSGEVEEELEKILLN